jgi:hypothetical protein
VLHPASPWLPPKPQFHPYFQEIQKYTYNSFDFVLVDGRAKVACMINAIDKIKKRRDIDSQQF